MKHFFPAGLFLFFFFFFFPSSGAVVAHFFITLRLSLPPDCTLNITENYQKVWWNCSKLFIKVCLCLNNKPISGVKKAAGFFSLCFQSFCVTGVIGIILLHNTHMSSLGFECLPLAVTVILFTSDLRDCLHLLQTERSLLRWWRVKKSATSTFFIVRGKKWLTLFFLIVWLIHFHISKEKISDVWEIL